MKCPVCAWEHPALLCPRCGFDSSRDYGKFPTFGTVGKPAAASAKRKEWEEKQRPAIAVPDPVTEITAPSDTPAAPIPAAGPAPKNKWIALLLCVFLGMFGAHKFYEGNKKMGFLYLCTLGLFRFGWLFDCVMLLFKPNPYVPRIRRLRLKHRSTAE